GGVARDVLGLAARSGNEIYFAAQRSVRPREGNVLAVGRPFLVENLRLIDKDLLIAAVRVHGPELAGANKADLAAVGRVAGMALGPVQLGQAFDLEAMSGGELHVGWVRFQDVKILLPAVAVGQENDLLAVTRPGDFVIVGGIVRQPRGLAAGAQH